MNINRRLEKLETAAKIQTNKIEVIRIIVKPDGNILSTIKRDASGKFISVSEDELVEIRNKAV